MGQTDKQLRYMEAMGIQAWRLRQAPPAEIQVETDQPVVEEKIPGETGTAQFLPRVAVKQDWPALEAKIKSCLLCELHQQRTQSVPGVGNHNADWMVIGEAPGVDEDRQGEPFVGRAGKLLDQMLLAIGLKRETVYITNIVKCRPPGNRDPKPEEAASCEAYLKRQIAMVQPKIILAVGRIAAHNLLKTDQRVGAMRGQRFEYADTGIPVVVTYHPAYLLRSPTEKRKAWQDLLLARSLMT